MYSPGVDNDGVGNFEISRALCNQLTGKFFYFFFTKSNFFKFWVENPPKRIQILCPICSIDLNIDKSSFKLTKIFVVGKPKMTKFGFKNFNSKNLMPKI